MAARRSAASSAAAAKDDDRRRAAAGRLSPRPAPRPSAGADGVLVVVAHEALASAAAEWQDRSALEAAAGDRLRRRVAELETALRRAKTEVKRRRELPNNEVFTKGLVEENHALVKRNRALVARLAHYQGRGFGSPTLNENKRSAERKPRQVSISNAVRSSAGTDQQVQTDSPPQQGEQLEISAQAAMAAVRPLVEALKGKLKALETDLARLQQENELLRVDLERSLGSHAHTNERSPSNKAKEKQTALPKENLDLRARVMAQSNLIKILEVRYQQLHEKAAQQAHLYQESLGIQKDLNTRLLEAQQLIGDQQQRLAQYSDQHALVEDLRKEVHILRAENSTLDDAISALSSRPFESLSKELQTKNLLIAELEAEKKEIGHEKARAERDLRAARRMTEQVRERHKELEAEIQALMLKNQQQQLECERAQMESEVGRLQLRFYTAPPDKRLLEALGHAVREMKKQEDIQAERKTVADTQGHTARRGDK